MKVIILAILIIRSGLCSKLEPSFLVKDESSSSLHRDLSEFISIIPVDEIRNLTDFFYANDRAMRVSYDYLRDVGFKLVVESLSKLSLVKKFTTFLNDSGVDFAELGKRIEKIVLTDEEANSIVGNCSSLIVLVVAFQGANLLVICSTIHL